MMSVYKQTPMHMCKKRCRLRRLWNIPITHTLQQERSTRLRNIVLSKRKTHSGMNKVRQRTSGAFPTNDNCLLPVILAKLRIGSPLRRKGEIILPKRDVNQRLCLHPPEMQEQ